MEEFLNVLNTAFKKPCHTSSIPIKTKYPLPIKTFIKKGFTTYGISIPLVKSKIPKKDIELMPPYSPLFNEEKFPNEKWIESGKKLIGGHKLIRLPMRQSVKIPPTWILYSDYKVDDPRWLTPQWKEIFIESITNFDTEPSILYTIDESSGNLWIIHKERTKCYN